MNRLFQYKAPWCTPCKTISTLINTYLDKYEIVIRDIEDEDVMNEAIANKVKSVPTVIIYDSINNEIARYVGTNDINKYNLDKHIND